MLERGCLGPRPGSEAGSFTSLCFVYPRNGDSVNGGLLEGPGRGKELIYIKH